MSFRDSSTKVRIEALNQLSRQVENSSHEELEEIIIELFSTHTYYQDNKSRSAALHIFEAIINKDNQVLNLLTKLFHETCSNLKSTAITDTLTLLEWCNHITVLSESLGLFDAVSAKLISSIVWCLDALCEYASDQPVDFTSTDKQTQHKRRVWETGLTQTRFAISSILKTSDISSFVDVLCSESSHLPKSGVLVAFGCVAGASIHLLPLFPSVYEKMHQQRSLVLEFFSKQVILGKNPPFAYAMAPWSEFIESFVEPTDFNKLILPSLEKGVLRSAEINLGVVAPALFKSIKQVDVEFMLKDSKLIGQILAGFKSSKELVRKGCSDTFGAILQHGAQGPTVAETLLKDHFFKFMKTVTSLEQKTCIVSCLKFVPHSCASIVVENLIPYISKDQNEISLGAFLEPFFVHLYQTAASEPALQVVKKGLQEKKWNLRKAWFVKMAEPLDSAPKTFVEDMKPYVKAAFDQVVESPLPVLNAKGIECFYVASALLKQSSDVICNSRIFSKLTSEQEQKWFLRALESLQDPTHGLPWLYVCTASTVDFNVRREALSKINDLASDSIIDAIYLSLKDNDLKLNLRSFSHVLSAITTAENASRVLVCSLHPQLKVKNGWIGLCMRCGIDPGSIVERHGIGMLEDAVAELVNASDEACFRAIACLSFINPQLISPLLANFISQDLDISRLKDIDAVSVQIWRNKGTEPVVDVLNKKSVSENKNDKDYELKKWEESVRKNKKQLSKDEQSLVNGQLAKEKQIRSGLQATVNLFRRGVGMCVALADMGSRAENGAHWWFPVAVERLLALLQIEVFNSLADGSVSFISLSKMLTSRLKTLAPFLGSAILRAYNVNGVPDNYCEEDLNSLLSRVMFRVKLLSDQSLLDPISLTYILPLLNRCLEIGASKKTVSTNSEFVDDDPEDEHLMLALDILSLHSEQFQNEYIPRKPMLDLLLTLLANPAKSRSAKDAFTVICQNISVSPKAQDLTTLLSGLMAPEPFVRNAILESLDAEFDLSGWPFIPELYVAVFDTESNNAELASTIWHESGISLQPDSPILLAQHLKRYTDARMRQSIALAISKCASLSGDRTFELLLQIYREDLESDSPKWETRHGVAETLFHMAPTLTTEVVSRLIIFLLELGLADTNEAVRQQMQSAGVAVVNSCDDVETLGPILEECLSAKEQNSVTQDRVRESCIIIYGSLARHLQPGDSRLDSVGERLIRTLDTPSEDVQYAVALCLAPLVGLFGDERIQSYFDALFTDKLPAKSLAVKRGAAYGIAGLVKGCGLGSIATYDVVTRCLDLRDLEAAFFVFECISRLLGSLFEPYIIELLTTLLAALGDVKPEVRRSADDAATVIMRNTTSYGVGQIVPLAIESLHEEMSGWRSKKAAVDLLGSMAYLDPSQLSSLLSEIVPEIVGVMNDTHREVRKAADSALKRFGEVIRNPEILALVPILVKAIADPAKCTDPALDALIKTQFVHYIDGPSLALIVHVIHRGMRDRSASTKRKACQIVGNMSILVDTKDLLPYLSQLEQEVESAMVDPVPNTRATAARALGSLVEKLGEERFPDLISRLMGTVVDETKAGDHLGSAQALAEVCSALGVGKLEALLPVFLENCASPSAHVRRGYFPMLLFLPVCFGAQFAPFLKEVTPTILAGIADQDDDVRDLAVRIARLFVSNYATRAVDLLLPELGKGLADPAHAIRLSSVQLTGNLLFQLCGISEKSAVPGSGKALASVLGQERKNSILGSLFMCRCDTVGSVRLAAADIWKILVENTPRTIREVLPELSDMLVRRLAGQDEVGRDIAASTLSELVERIGSDTLTQLLPHLHRLCTSPDPAARRGVCVAVQELGVADAGTDQADLLLSIVKDALMDQDEEVREAASAAFGCLLESMGPTAVDRIMPFMLQQLNTLSGVSGLKYLIASAPLSVFPVLVRALLSGGGALDDFTAEALGTLAEAAGGDALQKHLSIIIGALTAGHSDVFRESLSRVILAVDTESGVHPLMQIILSLVKSDNVSKRHAIFAVLPDFFKSTQLDYSIYVADFISQAVSALDDSDQTIVATAAASLTECVKAQPKESLERLVRPTREALSLTGISGQVLPGFAVGRGPGCILPIFVHGLMYGGGGETREVSALAIADLVSKSPAASLKIHVTSMVGPLIRVVGEKVSSDVKAAILYALDILFEKVAQFLKPFIPQLQRTFVKSLSDESNQTLRTRAAKGLGTLIEHQPRVDPLVAELVTGATKSTNVGITVAMLKALLEVINKAGDKMNETSKNSVLSLVQDNISSASDENLAIAYARLVGALSKVLKQDEGVSMLEEKVLRTSVSGDKFGILTLNAFLKDSPQHTYSVMEHVCNYVVTGMGSSDTYISENAVVAAGKILLLQKDVEEGVVFSLLEKVAYSAKFAVSVDTRRLALVVIRTVARIKHEFVRKNIDVIAPNVFACVRDILIPIKLAAEKAFLAIFQLVHDETGAEFQAWLAHATEDGTAAQSLRSITDYFKRVATRLANVERERIAAGGDAEAMFSDQFEDEQEIWAVGGVDLQ